MKPLDDPQLRAKLIRASSDMPHVDMWAKIQAEAGEISAAAQARPPHARFSIFSGLQALAPAFVVLLVFGVTLLSLTEEPAAPTRRTMTASAVQSVTPFLPSASPQVTAADPSDHVASPAYDRLMARYAERLEGVLVDGDDARPESLNVAYAHEPQGVTSVRVETRDDLRAEWQQYTERQQPRTPSSTLHLVRPFLSTKTPQ